MFVFVDSIVGFGVFDLGGFLQLIDQFLQLGILSLRDQFRLDLRTNLLERLGLAGFARGHLGQVETVRRAEHRADLAGFHRERHDLELIHQLAALEVAEVDLLRRLVGVFPGQLGEVSTIDESLSHLAKRLENLFALFDFANRLENMRGADLVLIAELVEAAVVKLAALRLGRRWECLTGFGAQCLDLQIEAEVAPDKFILLRCQAGVCIKPVAAAVFLLEFVKRSGDFFRRRLGNRPLRLLCQQRPEGDVVPRVAAKLTVSLTAGDRAQAFVMGLDRGEFLVDDVVTDCQAVDNQWHAASSAASAVLAMAICPAQRK